MKKMKTLDEVINELHYWDTCDEFPESFYDFEVTTDALYHLNKYRMTLDDIVAKREALETEIARYQEAVRNCEDAENKYRQLAQNLGEVGNEPLKWRELRQLEGKPVWIELLKGKWKGWDVIGGFDEDDFGVAMVTISGDDYYKADLGNTWQAYRKERHEG